jgi:hypothetical protein
MNIERITLTGADERTDIDALVQFAHRFPEVELGLLYTATPEGRPRYPSRDWLARAAAALSGRVAIHVCGGGARRELLEGRMSDLTRHAPRIQVNGLIEVEEAERLAALVATLITQHNEANSHLLQVRARNHALLVDASGGRGVSPDLWQPPSTDKATGFAGGMGPANLATEYQRIAGVAKPGAWSDMEGKLRVEDWFSLPLAVQCATIHREARDAATNAAPRGMRMR